MFKVGDKVIYKKFVPLKGEENSQWTNLVLNKVYTVHRINDSYRGNLTAISLYENYQYQYNPECFKLLIIKKQKLRLP